MIKLLSGIVFLALTGCATTRDVTTTNAVSSNSYDTPVYYDAVGATPTPDDNFEYMQNMVNTQDELNTIQQMNDTESLNESMQAAEEQNDEANAATLQTEINAGM